LVITAFAASTCFAQQAATPAKAVVVAPKAPEVKTITGKVESVSVASPATGEKSEIVVVGKNGEKAAFLVKATTTLYDSGWKSILLSDVKKDEKIKVKYTTTKEGVNEASLINLIK